MENHVACMFWCKLDLTLPSRSDGVLILSVPCVFFIIYPTGLACEDSLQEIVCPESLLGWI